jgi:glycosyltransferase involved in cell wall biosynthesis
MKIAINVPYWPPGSVSNGIVTYTSSLIPELRQLGHEVFVLVGSKASSDDDPYTIELQQFARPPSFTDRVMRRLAPDTVNFNLASFRLAGAIRHLVARHQIDVYEKDETFGVSLGLSDLNLLPVIVRLHGPWFLTGRPDSTGGNFSADLRRCKRESEAIRRASFVTSPSAAVLEAVKHRYGFKLAASSVIRNPMKAAEASETWDVNTCTPDTFLFVGRFDAPKGGDLALLAFADLAASHPNVRLTFVGPDNGIKQSNGSEILFQEFIRSNVPEQYRVRIDFRGPMRHSEIASYRRAHFAMIVASQYENASYSILEAMSLGCPIIATAVGGTPELIKHRKNGLLVPSQNAEALANACRQLLQDHSLAARLGRQAWRDCGNMCDPKSIAKQTVAAYQKAIDAFRSDSNGASTPSLDYSAESEDIGRA